METTASGHYCSTMSSLLSSNVVRIIVYGSLKSVLRRNLSTESKTVICYRKAKRMSEKYKISKKKRDDDKAVMQDHQFTFSCIFISYSMQTRY